MRDIEAPSARWTNVPGDWVTGNQAQVEWQAADNFGSDGIGQQRIGIGGRALYAAAPGPGLARRPASTWRRYPTACRRSASRSTAMAPARAAFQDATLRIDRTPPSASITLIGLPDDGVRVTVSVADATSGVHDWTLRARGPDGPTVASSTTGGETRDIDLSTYAAPGETIRFVLERERQRRALARGHLGSRHPPERGDRRAQTTTIVGGDGPLGEPGRIEASGVPLPNFSRIETRAIRTNQTRSYSRSGRLLVPLIAATYSRPVRISGRFLHPNGRGLRGATVYLLDPEGFSHGTTLTDRRGRFTFQVRPRRSGTWRAIALGRPLVVAPGVIQLRPLVTTRISARSIQPGETLRISGAIAPRGAGRGKLVKLEWRQDSTWRPLALATADRRGRYVLSYRFSAGAGAFTIPLRVVVPREKGWPFLPVVAKRLEVRVG